MLREEKQLFAEVAYQNVLPHRRKLAPPCFLSRTPRRRSTGSLSPLARRRDPLDVLLLTFLRLTLCPPLEPRPHTH